MYFPTYMPLGSPTKSPLDLKKTLGSRDLEVSMVGLKLGASVLQLGARGETARGTESGEAPA